MSDSASAPKVQEGSTSEAMHCILGECVLKLTHSTTYEPPLYLFPELLPQVPQGTPPLPVWDAVADAVDIGASSWRIADATQLLAAGAASSTVGVSASTTQSTAAARAPQAMVTLASMVAENRLLAAGLDATALRRGAFSASQVIQQLGTLQARMGLSDAEGAAIMSNHFINLLAWQKLREINGEADRARATSSTAEESSSASPAPSRKRSRAAEAQDGTEEWQPSPHPWTSEKEFARRAVAGEKFVSAAEQNVETRVELLQTLAELYRRPWRTLASRGQQTDCVVPPGTVNATSPYADSGKVPGAMLDPVADLEWGVPAAVPVAPATSSTGLYFGSVRVAHTPCFYSVVLSARNAASSSSSDSTTRPLRVPLHQLVTYFGRDEGVQHASAVAAAALVPIAAGLSAFSTRPDVLSKFHFALVLRPVYHHEAALAGSSQNAALPAAKKEVSDEEEEGNGGSGALATPKEHMVVHTKTPDHYALWLVNYGRNGVRIAGKAWVLGEPRELHDGDVLVVGDDVELRVEQHATAAAAEQAMETENAGGSHNESITSSQVKRERADDE